MKDDGGHGKLVEQLVERLCTVACSSTFIFQGQKYKKGGRPKELCDTLIMFRGTAVVVQVKSASVQTKNKVSQGEAEEWVKNATQAAERQARGAIGAMRKGLVTTLTNDRQRTTCFSHHMPTRVLVLLVIDSPWDNGIRPSAIDDVRWGACDVIVLNLRELGAFMAELSTIPELIEYLNLRASICRRVRQVIGRELDLLAFVRMQRERALSLLDEEGPTTLVLEDHLWGRLATDARVLQRNEDDRISFLIDDVIEKAWDIDRELCCDSMQGGEGDGDRLARFAAAEVAIRLSSLTRTERRLLARMMIEKMEASFATKITRYCAWKDPATGEGVVFLATPEIRSERREMVTDLASLAWRVDLMKSPIGIATEPIRGGGRSFDFVIIDPFGNEPKPPPDAEDVALAEQVFAQPKHVVETQYRKSGQARSYKRRRRRSR